MDKRVSFFKDSDEMVKALWPLLVATVFLWDERFCVNEVLYQLS